MPLYVDDEQGDKDLSKHRIIDLDNDNKIHLERRDPYGYIHVWLDKGSFPAKSQLNGVFTSFDRAYQAVEGYISDRNAAVSEVRAVAIEGIRETVEETRSVATPVKK